MPEPTALSDLFIDTDHAINTRQRLGNYTVGLSEQVMTLATALQLARAYGHPTEAIQSEHDRLTTLWCVMAKVNTSLSDSIAEWMDK